MAVIAGAQVWEDSEESGINQQELLKTFLELPFICIDLRFQITIAGIFARSLISADAHFFNR
ncbi:hypothetical protein H6G36_04005 [Anabaena minutissima FACHB-250]|nr:hypothetical protein [Anabaena minutissima FACHB-250]